MEHWYQWAPVGGAILAGWSAWRVPRAVTWLLLLMLSFVLSTLWWDWGGAYPSMFGAATDFIIALIMLRFKRNKWEDAIIAQYLVMILIDIMWQGGAIPEHYLYAVSLEVLNWTIIATIGIQGLLDRGTYGWAHSRRRRAGALGVARDYMGKESRYPRWWQNSE